MTRNGHADSGLLAAHREGRSAARASSLLGPRGVAFVGALAGIATSLYFWGFCVDDALIPLRYAQNLVTGHGYTMSPGAPRSDGVTPLPWAFLIAPFATTGSLWTALARTKSLGIALHGIVCALVSRRAGQDLAARRWVTPLVLAGMLLATPIAAWAASGMEIELAALLIAIAVATDVARPVRALLLGLAATVRPELGAFAVALSLGDALATEGRAVRPRVLLAAFALAAAPFAAVAILRVAVFGHAAPLSVAAKPSDLTHGALYAAAAAIACVGPIAAFAPIAIAKDARCRALAAACLMHLVAVVLVGGDSMPLARLLVPVAPAFFVLASRAAARARAPAILLRGVLVLAIDVFGLLKWAPDARRSLSDRERLAAEATPLLAGAHVVASVDIGWVAAATDARLVDLAGVTDPEIAYLPGGHTSKSVSASLLESRGTDMLVVLEKDGAPGRVVEARLLASSFVREHFEREATIPIGTTGLSYGFYKKTR
jgi:hypothetical protein